LLTSIVKMSFSVGVETGRARTNAANECFGAAVRGRAGEGATSMIAAAIVKRRACARDQTCFCFTSRRAAVTL
jgi:hypothetical protein